MVMGCDSHVSLCLSINRKIIGARCYSFGRTDCSARDDDGHGTHVASIAAGRVVKDASFYGLAHGIARGGVPSARISVYKVCDDIYCEDEDILSAFDDAIADGVDIITISLGKRKPIELTSDPTAIGAFHAIERNILTVNSAGNDGPQLYSVSSFAPWILSVAASDIDKKIVSKVILGDYKTLVGTSINAFPSSDGELLPLVYGKEVTSRCSETDARDCHPECLDREKVNQKVVLCDDKDYLLAVIKAGAVGCIIPNFGNNASEVEPFPVASLSSSDMSLVKAYKNSTKKPIVHIFNSEVVHNPTAPHVASFSARGPSRFIPDIVKPDVTAPGVEIIAAFSPQASPSATIFDKRSVKYDILSGTSMACPHVAAAAAFVKSFHPQWSPSAIKSALMTTALEMNPIENTDAEFAYGSGHIDPVKANDPGLVYETTRDDYLKIWCNVSQNTNTVGLNRTCPEKLTPKDINYPSMAIRLHTKSAFAVSFTRTVTNVGQPNSTYVASIQGVSHFHITVKPNNLPFTALNQKISFVVNIRGIGIKSSTPTMVRLSLLWTDGIHRVRSPIVIYTDGRTTSGGQETPSFCKNMVVTLLVMVILLLLY